VTGRVLYAALHLLDHQLVDREGRLCGKLEDLELETNSEGTTYVTAILTGPGTLWERFGRRRIATWLRSYTPTVFEGAEPDPGRLPMWRVSDIGPAIHINASRDEIATAAVEHWVRDHIIAHVPGSRHDVDE
jgi:hypothetical protein